MIKRVWIDKDNGKKRPIGLSEIEDKIVQKAATMWMKGVRLALAGEGLNITLE